MFLFFFNGKSGFYANKLLVHLCFCFSITVKGNSTPKSRFKRIPLAFCGDPVPDKCYFWANPLSEKFVIYYWAISSAHDNLQKRWSLYKELLIKRWPFVLTIFLKTLNEMLGWMVLLFSVCVIPFVKDILAQVILED